MITPYPTIEELSLGASPAIEAIVAAVIIGAIAASSMETLAERSSQEKIKHIPIAMSGEMISFINKAALKGLISSRFNLNSNCKPTATIARGTTVADKLFKSNSIEEENVTPLKKSATIKAINGGKVITL